MAEALAEQGAKEVLDVRCTARKAGSRTAPPGCGLYLRDGIYELRRSYQGVNYRILYFYSGKDVAVLSHGITKEGAVPDVEINRAIERKKRFEDDPKAHTYKPGK